MNEIVEALILKEQDYKENAVILTVITKEYGRISLVGQGIRKMTSKNRASVFPYTKAEVQFDYKEGKTMFRLKTTRTLSFYRFVHSDLNAGLACGVLAEVMDAFLPENSDYEFSAFCYDLFEEFCSFLEEQHRADIVLAVALAKLLESQGIGPVVDECVLCGNQSVASISVREGGFLCHECAISHGAPMKEAADLRRFRLLNKAELRHIDILESHMDSAMDDCTLLVEFIRMHAGLSVKSYALFQQMFLV